MLVFRRLSATLLVLTMIAIGCDLGAACAIAQTAEAGCCCPVQGPSPCLESGDMGESPMSNDRDASLDNGKPAQTALLPSASPLPGSSDGDRCSASAFGASATGHGQAAVHVLNCVYLC